MKRTALKIMLPEELQHAATELVRKLNGNYIDSQGRHQKVRGDLTKLRYMRDLSEGAKRMIQNLEHSGRQLKGTMEVRRMMRFQTHGVRIRHGVPIFITFSPDEKHNMLMLRFYRARKHDPMHQLDHKNEAYGARLEPNIDHDFVEMGCDINELDDIVPTYDERRAIMSRCPLASVDGFWISVLLVCEYALGIRICPNCPTCNHKNHSSSEDSYHIHCQDIFGNSAYSDGGSFGRVTAMSLSVEAQKSAGALHAHGQMHIQCLHQHLPLTEVMEKIINANAGSLLCYPANFPHVYGTAHTEMSAGDVAPTSHRKKGD